MDDRTDDTLDTAERRHLDTNDNEYDFFYSNHQMTHRRTSTQETGADIEPARREHYFIVQATYYYNIYTHSGIISDAHGDQRSVPHGMKRSQHGIYIHTRHGPGALLSKHHNQQTIYILMYINRETLAYGRTASAPWGSPTNPSVVVFTHSRTPIAYTHS